MSFVELSKKNKVDPRLDRVIEVIGKHSAAIEYLKNKPEPQMPVVPIPKDWSDDIEAVKKMIPVIPAPADLTPIYNDLNFIKARITDLSSCEPIAPIYQHTEIKTRTKEFALVVCILVIWLSYLTFKG